MRLANGRIIPFVDREKIAHEEKRLVFELETRHNIEMTRAIKDMIRAHSVKMYELGVVIKNLERIQQSGSLATAKKATNNKKSVKKSKKVNA